MVFCVKCIVLPFDRRCRRAYTEKCKKIPIIYIADNRVCRLVSETGVTADSDGDHCDAIDCPELSTLALSRNALETVEQLAFVSAKLRTLYLVIQTSIHPGRKRGPFFSFDLTFSTDFSLDFLNSSLSQHTTSFVALFTHLCRRQSRSVQFSLNPIWFSVYVRLNEK